MKIIIAHFGTYYVNMAGGVEKVTCNLANALVKRGHEVTILYRDDKEGEPYFPLDKRVKQHNILFENGQKIVSEKLPLALRIMRELVRPFKQSAAQAINAKFKGKQYGPQIRKFLDSHPADVILSCSVPSAKYVIEDAGCTLPVVKMIHAHPNVQFPNLSKSEIRAVKKCRVMQILVPSGLDMAHRYFPGLPVVVIGNAVAPARKIAHPGKGKNHYKIICVGNISGRKQQLMLVKAFLPLMKDFPNWSVDFWGDDSSFYAKKMKEYVAHKHIGNAIHICGKTDRIDDVYADADIFCMPSRDEGFPLALTEAMAAGLPAVGFNDSTGVNDIIENEINGYLVARSTLNLSKALKKLMQNSQLREEMGTHGIRSMQQYEPNRIWDQWEDVIAEVAEKDCRNINQINH